MVTTNPGSIIEDIWRGVVGGTVVLGYLLLLCHVGVLVPCGPMCQTLERDPAI